MKAPAILGLLLIFFFNGHGQTKRTLEETKSYIVKMIDEYCWEHNSSKKKLRAEFDGDLLKIISTKSTLGNTAEHVTTYNFAHVYKFKGPIREPGNIGRLIIWVDCLKNPNTQKWKKENLDIDVYNFDAADQLITAFMHLNTLLQKNKPPIEKF